MKANKTLFDGLRSQMYQQALMDYPNARDCDMQVMFRYLAP